MFVSLKRDLDRIKNLLYSGPTLSYQKFNILLLYMGQPLVLKTFLQLIFAVSSLLQIQITFSPLCHTDPYPYKIWGKSDHPQQNIFKISGFYFYTRSKIYFSD